MRIREYIYQVCAKFGIRCLSKIFPEYFAKEPLAPSDRYCELPFVIKNLPRPPARVLDVGSSGSFFSLLLAAFGYDAYGIDIRGYPILNKMKFDNFRFTKCDIRRTEFPDNYFDAVCAVSTLEHVGLSGRYGMDEDMDGDKRAAKEIWRILKIGGIFLMTVPFGKARIIRPYSRVYGTAQIKELSQGFRVEKAEYYMQDGDNDWRACAVGEAEKIDATSERYPLALVKMVKV